MNGHNSLKATEKLGSYYLSKVEKAYRLPLANDYFSNLYREHFVQTCQGVLYSNLAKPIEQNDFVAKRVYLKRK